MATLKRDHKELYAEALRAEGLDSDPTLEAVVLSVVKAAERIWNERSKKPAQDLKKEPLDTRIERLRLQFPTEYQKAIDKNQMARPQTEEAFAMIEKEVNATAPRS